MTDNNGSNWVYHNNRLLWLVLLIISKGCCIDWNSAIIATRDEEIAAHTDRLYKYFGQKVDDGSLFRTQQQMQQLIGDFKDVDRQRYMHKAIFLRQSLPVG